MESPGDGSFAEGYLVTEVLHVGEQPDVAPGSETLQGVYHNQFSLLPRAVPYRPRRLTPIPHIAGIQTATVVGPAGEEIHTDPHGRVKVHFHWDREALRDEKSSCWVRVGQPWGGAAWGDVWLPRIGQEVLVRFLEGNPDRPLIAGAVYNGANPVPYALPDEKTKSTRKSASSLGSAGFNEVRIEDAAGMEELFIHAQKDEDLLTENDKEQHVRGHEDLRVTKDRQRTTEGHQELFVRQDDVSRVEGHQSLTVRKNRDLRTQGNHDEAVEGHQTMTVAKSLTLTVTQGAMENVGAAKATTIGGAYSINVGMFFNEATGGVKTVEVGGFSDEQVLGHRHELVAGDKQTRVGADWQTDVTGMMTQTTAGDLRHEIQGKWLNEVKEPTAILAKQFELKADTFILGVGDHLILKLEKSGRVQLFARSLTLDGTEVKLRGSKVQKTGAGALSSAQKTPVKIDRVAELKPRHSTKVQVKGDDGKPLGGRSFEVKLPDGKTQTGQLDAHGMAVIESAEAGAMTLSLPDLDA